MNESISLIVNPDDSWGRGVITGVINYAYDHLKWRVRIVPPEEMISSVKQKKNWFGQGVIALINSPLMAKRLVSLQIPIVDLDNIVINQKGTSFGRVLTDDLSRVNLVVEHFVDQGISRFACFAPPSKRYTDSRMNDFENAVLKRGDRCERFRYQSRQYWWNLESIEQQELILSWLQTLPQQTGIFTADAHQARLLSEVCQFNDIRIPEQIAIIAGDWDELLCSVSRPTISAVLLASERIGFDATRLLERMIKGEPPPKKPILIQPLRIIPQESTDVLFLEDELLGRAIYYIRNHACNGIDVSDILNEIPISRRSLELKCKELIGRTPAQEIRRIKLEKAKQMLIDSNKSIEQITRLCGFSEATQFCVIFRKQFAETPLAFRKRCHNDW